jgi:hypothetical protein
MNMINMQYVKYFRDWKDLIGGWTERKILEPSLNNAGGSMHFRGEVARRNRTAHPQSMVKTYSSNLRAIPIVFD